MSNNQRQSPEYNTKNNFQYPLTFDDNFDNLYIGPFNDPSLSGAWVCIAVCVLFRNAARACFVLERDGVELESGSLHALFHRLYKNLSRYDLRKETVAWRFITGGAFWRPGPDCPGVLPKLPHILNLRKLQLWEGLGVCKQRLPGGFINKKRRRLYSTGAKLVPVLSNKIINLINWDPPQWVNPLVSPTVKRKQDYYANMIATSGCKCGGGE